jgi:hypothetical protein
LAAKLAGPDYAPLLLPFITERLEIHEAGGGYRVEAKNLPTLDHLAEELRSDPKFARIIIGASATEQANHAARVAATLGLTPPTPPLTRLQFERLSPAQRSDHARKGTQFIDG